MLGVVRGLRSQVGEDLGYDDSAPYARLFMRSVSSEYAGHVFRFCTETGWVGAFCSPLGDYELVATSAFRPQPGSVFTDTYGVTSDATVVSSVDETFDAIAPAFEEWAELGEIEVGDE